MSSAQVHFFIYTRNSFTEIRCGASAAIFAYKFWMWFDNKRHSNFDTSWPGTYRGAAICFVL